MRTEHMDLVVRIQAPSGDNTLMRHFTGERDEVWLFDTVNKLCSGRWHKLEGTFSNDIEDTDVKK